MNRSPSHNPEKLQRRQQIGKTPTVTADCWGFALGGLVELPLLLSYNDLAALDRQQITCMIHCSGSLLSVEAQQKIHWQGIPLQTLLDEAQARPEARYASLYAADGYTTSVPLEDLKTGFLATHLNDQPLTSQQGFPARLVIPGLYGYKLPKWLQHIHLTSQQKPGYWEKRGWPASGKLTAAVAIHQPVTPQPFGQSIDISGIVSHGVYPVKQIEISVDGGPWMPVPFVQDAIHKLVHWSIEWTPPAPGSYEVCIRAWADATHPQPKPDAAHRLTVAVL